MDLDNTAIIRRSHHRRLLGFIPIRAAAHLAGGVGAVMVGVTAWQGMRGGLAVWAGAYLYLLWRSR